VSRIVIAMIIRVQAAPPRAPGDPHYAHDVADRPVLVVEERPRAGGALA
jgi:hypothetical protein